MRSVGLAVSLMVVGSGLLGCSLDGLLKSDELPPTVTDPAITETPAGALAAYHGTIGQLRDAFGVTTASVVAMAGILSDELRDAGSGGSLEREDRRSLPVAGSYQSDNAYAALQKVRGQAAQTLGLLTRYQSEAPALAGHVYALTAYAELFLGELFCSGIPLSTLDYGGDYTYRPGSSMAEVFAHAAALFDTALALSGDSASMLNLARIGQARVWLGLGEYARAAAVVAAVPDDYRYVLTYNASEDAKENLPNFFTNTAARSWELTVADREGGNGLDWRSSGDPRTPTTNLGTSQFPKWHPDRYAVDGSSSIVMASGVEARLIEAEAAFQSGNPSWLTALNTLRTDGTQDGSNTYNPGTGGVAGLAPLTDPGAGLSDPTAAAAARVDLLFRERGFWLFLTGHRQGDLRRLIRQYGRTENQVYPTGAYGSLTAYGTDVTFPVPSLERVLNPQFTGCASRGA